jgi:hypothetical protein
MKLITEVIDQIRVIEEAKDDGKKTLHIEGVFLQGNIPNRNKRIYKTETLEREVNRYIKESVNKGRAFGELGHPDGPGINLDRVSHMITELRRDGDNFIGKAKIASTPMGKTVSGLISDGAQLGVSSRGMGSLKANKSGIQEVQDDYRLVTAADIVADPSAPDAFVNGIMEGVEWVWDNGKLISMSNDQIVKEINEASRNKKLNEQFKIKQFQKFLDSLSKI